MDFAVIDFETDPFVYGEFPVPFAGAYYGGAGLQIKTIAAKLFWSLDCPQKIVDLCCSEGLKRNGKLMVYAHNGGKFDFHFMLEHMVDKFGADNLTVLAIGSRLVEIKTPLFILRDSYALLPKALKHIGQKLDIDINKLKRAVRNEHKTEIKTYLKQDCSGLYEALEEFFGMYGREITLASTAFKVLKRDFNMKPIRTSQQYDDLFRPFYFAGRVQFWELGKCEGDFKVIDINSAFPWAMRFRHMFGSEYIRLTEYPKFNKDQSFYRVTADSDGALPYRKEDGGVDFPTIEQGEFFATGWELFSGIELGLIKNVKLHYCLFPLKCDHFSGYVDYFYDQKKNAINESERNFSKLFLNSLYGKFGTNSKTFRDIKITEFGDIPKPKIVKAKGGGDIVTPYEHSFDDLEKGLSFWKVKTHIEGSKKPIQFYNVGTAASITGCVRAFLLRSISKCSRVLYCDTDSIIAESIGDLALGNELGEWKLEAECSRLYIGGKKLYAAEYKNPLIDKETGKEIKYKTASKGVRLTPDQIIRLAEGEKQTSELDAPSYSLFSKPRAGMRRVVRRDDQRQKKIKKV